MIIWIASYPKSGNTYIRSFLSAYYYSVDGNFNFNLLNNIKQFPNDEFFDVPFDSVDQASNNWLKAQEKIKDKNKAIFLKTHSCLGQYKGKPFTTPDLSLGGIYIVRDPRNVVTSLMNHFSMNLENAYEFIIDSNRNIKKANSDDYRNWVLISSWSNHYKSWCKSKNFRKLILKFEEFENNKYEIFRDIIVFTNTLLNRSERVDKKKLEMAINSTDFKVLKDKEIKEGFNEAALDENNGKKTFFNKGFNNNWRNLLRKDIRIKIENEFNKEMKELGYLN